MGCSDQTILDTMTVMHHGPRHCHLHMFMQVLAGSRNFFRYPRLLFFTLLRSPGLVENHLPLSAPLGHVTLAPTRELYDST